MQADPLPGLCDAAAPAAPDLCRHIDMVFTILNLVKTVPYFSWANSRPKISAHRARYFP